MCQIGIWSPNIEVGLHNGAASPQYMLGAIWFRSMPLAAGECTGTQSICVTIGAARPGGTDSGIYDGF